MLQFDYVLDSNHILAMCFYIILDLYLFIHSLKNFHSLSYNVEFVKILTKYIFKLFHSL